MSNCAAASTERPNPLPPSPQSTATLPQGKSKSSFWPQRNVSILPLLAVGAGLAGLVAASAVSGGLLPALMVVAAIVGGLALTYLGYNLKQLLFPKQRLVTINAIPQQQSIAAPSTLEADALPSTQNPSLEHQAQHVRFNPIINTASDLTVDTQAPPERESNTRYPYQPYPLRPGPDYCNSPEIYQITSGKRGGAAYEAYLHLFEKEIASESFSTIVQKAEDIGLETLERALDTAIFEHISQSHVPTHGNNKRLQIVEIFRDLLDEFLDRPLEEMQNTLESFCQTLSTAVIDKLKILHDFNTLSHDLTALHEELNRSNDNYSTEETRKAFEMVLRAAKRQFTNLDEQVKDSRVLSQISAILSSDECQIAVRRFLEQEIRAERGAAAAAE